MPHIDWHAPAGNGKDWFVFFKWTASSKKWGGGKEKPLDWFEKNISEPSEVGGENTEM